MALTPLRVENELALEDGVWLIVTKVPFRNARQWNTCVLKDNGDLVMVAHRLICDDGRVFENPIAVGTLNPEAVLRRMGWGR
jgi:hypothetical protein